ncbi:MAG: transporter substrate-binding domain-containing protein, partial [Candidatus Thioglobus sp.]
MLILIVIFSANASYAAKTINACGHPDYPPFMWQEMGKNDLKTVGVATEIAQIIFGELNIKVNSNFNGNWKRCLREIEIGRYDLLVSAYVNDERRVYAKFTENYISDDPTAVFVWKGREFTFEKWEDLIGKEMGGILGGSIGKEWDEFSVKKLNVTNVSTRKQLFLMLKKERIYFTPTGLYTGQIQVKKLGYDGKIIALQNPIKTGYLYVAMSKKSAYLKHLPYVNKRLAELRNDGTIKKLLDKYVDYYAKTQTKSLSPIRAKVVVSVHPAIANACSKRP